MKKHAKQLALLLAATMMIGCMAGCNGKKDPEVSDTPTPPAAQNTPEVKTEDEITLTFWYTYGDNEEAQLLNVALPLWEAEHPNIKIEVVRQDDSQYHQMIVTSFGTGMSPDVARVDITNVAAYASQGGLVALSDFDDFASISGDYLEGPLSSTCIRENTTGSRWTPTAKPRWSTKMFFPI